MQSRKRKLCTKQLGSISLLAVSVALPAYGQQSLPTIEIGATPLRSQSRAPARPVAAPVRPVASGPSQPSQSQPSPGSSGNDTPAPYVSPLVTYQVPAAVHVVEGSEIANVRKFNVGEALQRAAPGVLINDVGGNPFLPELNYRGFNASPYSGTPQGLAVFQNGIRINEMWGDTVNWDLIPSIAIDRVAIETGNPLYGLNAIGGAVVLDMKNGFTWKGLEVDARGGSFNRRLGTVQYGKQVGDFAIYGAGEAAGDSGYRYFSGSQVKRFYGDVGYKAEQGEAHANVTLGGNYFGATGPAPMEMAAANKSSVYTTPQNYKNQLAMFDLNGQVQVNPTTKLLADVHYRGFNQARTDGNTTEFQCDPNAEFCSTQDGATTNIPNLFQNASPYATSPAYGVIDRTWTKTNTIGFTTQINNTDRILGFQNKFTGGLNLEHGFTGFQASEQWGLINRDFTVTGLNYYTNEPANGVAPVSLNVANYYLGAYALDTLELTDKLSINGGLRFNQAQINMFDNRATRLNGAATFNHVNPMGGVTYKLTPEIASYASYSEANRTPTPLEFGCADPNNPCLIDSFLVSDPPLKQVTSNTIDTGIRGGFKPAEKLPVLLAALPGAVQWTAGLFRTNVFNDILNIPSQFQGRGYFTNAGNTVRQGVELSMRYNDDRTAAYMNYTLTDAYFNSYNFLGSPNNPVAQATGISAILVTPGATLPSNAKHRFKTGIDYSVTKKWKIGGDFVFATGPYLQGDWANQFGQLSSYGVLNLRTSYNFLPNVQAYALIENVTNTRTQSFGSFFQPSNIPFAYFNNPKMVSVGPPTAFFAGMKWDYGNDPNTSSWIASAEALYKKEAEKEYHTPTQKKWSGFYTGLNAGYGWGSTTAVNTTSFGLSDPYANYVNNLIQTIDPTANNNPLLSVIGSMAGANTGVANVNRRGFIGGGQIGYNYQDESNVVLGLEGDIQGTLSHGIGSYTSGMADHSYGQSDATVDQFSFTRTSMGGGTISSSINWIGTFRGRLGYPIMPSLLIFGTGGLATGDISASATHWSASTATDTYFNAATTLNSYSNPAIPGQLNYSGMKTGWTAGAGLEWMFAENWSAKAEGLYYDLGYASLASSPVTTLCGAATCLSPDGGTYGNGLSSGAALWSNLAVTKIKFDGVIARAGVNYHFNFGKEESVITKY